MKHFIEILIIFDAGHIKALQFDKASDNDMSDYRNLMEKNEHIIDIYSKPTSTKDETMKFLRINKAKIAYMSITHRSIA